MKKVFFYILFFLSGIAFFGCSGTKVNGVAYVPFTTALKQRILNNNLDIKKVQFFVDQKLVLRRSLGTKKVDIKSGVLLFEDGQYIQEVIIPRYTPGVCESINGDNLMLSFEEKNNDIAFGPGPNEYTRDLFMLYGRNWNNGRGELTYDDKVYKVTCGSCDNASSAKLVVKKSEADKFNKSQRTLKGRKVE